MNIVLMLATCYQLFTVEVIPAGAPSFTVSVEEPQQAEAPKEPRKCLTMFTASWCGPCQTWKSTVYPRLVSAGYTVQFVEMTDAKNQRAFGNRVDRYPAFLVTDYDSGKWLSEFTFGPIGLDEAVRMLDGSGSGSNKGGAVEVAQPARFIQWPGWGTIDLETYDRDCDCSMCQSIRVMQRDYRSKKAQTKVTPDQEGTPDEVVSAMLDSMELRDSDVLADLGSGDGRILIAAAKRGIRAIGVEIDPARAKLARQKVQDAGVAHLVTIEEGDALNFDTSRATVITTYLYPPLLEKLVPKLKKARIVASPYHPIPGLTMVKRGQVYFSENAK